MCGLPGPGWDTGVFCTGLGCLPVCRLFRLGGCEWAGGGKNKGENRGGTVM